MPRSDPSPARHHVVALLSTPQSPYELATVSEIFGRTRPGVAEAYSYAACTETGGPVDLMGGCQISVGADLSEVERADTVMIPAWRPDCAPASPALLEALIAAHERGARIVSLCTGAFLLAQTGLLDHRSATTHWAYVDAFAAAYPSVRVESDPLFIDLGDVATSAGTAAGVDLCLHIVRKDLGAAQAARIARHMVMPPRREGGQRQYAVPEDSGWLSDSIGEVLEWAQGHLGERLTIEALATQAHVSPRTLNRRFREQLGLSPGQWVMSQRLEFARELLESSPLSVEAVASRTGLSTGSNLRRRFYKAFGTTPAAYRRTFQRVPA